MNKTSRKKETRFETIQTKASITHVNFADPAELHKFIHAVALAGAVYREEYGNTVFEFSIDPDGKRIEFVPKEGKEPDDGWISIIDEDGTNDWVVYSA